MKRNALSLLIFSFFIALTFSQTKISYSGNSGYSLVERTNLRRYVNGKYSGLTSREVRSFISRGTAPQGIYSTKSDRWYDGNFFVAEETLRNSKSTMAGIHDAISSVFKISPDGKMTMIEDNGYPTFRSFPSYSAEDLKIGDSWKAEAERAVDPMNKGIFTRIPILVLYTFEGEEFYKGENVYRIKAIWQTNYGFSNFNFDPKGDSSLKKATGGHKADIIVRKETGEAILIIDNVDETFTYSDGNQVNLKGSITMFTEYPPAFDHEKLIFALNRIAKVDNASGKTSFSSSGSLTSASSSKSETNKEKSSSSAKGSSASASSDNTSSQNKYDSNNKYKNFPSQSDKIASTKDSGKSYSSSTKASEKNNSSTTRDSQNNNSSPVKKSGENNSSSNNMVYEETPAGIRLSIRNINFKADSDEVLSSEESRLDEIAEVLKLAPDSQFLIEGHTASVGKPEGEQKLSLQRAKRIASELAKRGISADRFICKGHGGNKPLADNSSNTGRSQNRRVEITILE